MFPGKLPADPSVNKKAYRLAARRAGCHVTSPAPSGPLPQHPSWCPALYRARWPNPHSWSAAAACWSLLSLHWSQRPLRQSLRCSAAAAAAGTKHPLADTRSAAAAAWRAQRSKQQRERGGAEGAERRQWGSAPAACLHSNITQPRINTRQHKLWQCNKATGPSAAPCKLHPGQ